MFKETEFRGRCKARGMNGASAETAVAFIRDMERTCSGKDATLATSTLESLETRLELLVATGKAGEKEAMALARYFSVLGIDALTIRFLAYLLPIGVLPGMRKRLLSLEGADACATIMKDVCIPPPGSAPEKYPEAAKKFVRALEHELGKDKARKVLTWNVHGIPATAHAKEREFFLASKSLDTWLADSHARQVEVLARHAKDGTLWFEQKITDAVVDWVRSHQEILGGVRSGDRILLTKIPYDPDRYLRETDPLIKRTLACHCPLAASSITDAGSDVPSLWCNCSAGFEKFRFDIVFGEETEAKVISSVLEGADICRYEITIPKAITTLSGA